MTRDDILRMAREQGLPETEVEGVFRVNSDDLGRLLAAAKREWVGLTDEDFPAMRDGDHAFYSGMFCAEAKLKEKNT